MVTQEGKYMEIFAAIVGYLMGSLSSAILLCRLFGLPDPRTVGSQNPGATNVLRVGGKKVALLTLVGDMLKVMIPIWIFYALGFPKVVVWVLLGAFVGHVWPIFFGFKGGKGVATALGGLFAVHLSWGFIVAITWILSAVFFRISSLAAISAFTGLIFYACVAWALQMPGVDFYQTVLPLTVMSLIILLRHRANMIRLLAGTEARIGRKKS